MVTFLIACLVPLTIWHFFLCFICLCSKSEKLFSDERDKKILTTLLCLKENNDNTLYRLFICIALFICSLTGAIVGLLNQDLEEGMMAAAFFTIIPLVIAFYLFYQYFKNFKESTRKQKIVKSVCGTLCVCIAIAMTILIVINPSFHSSSTTKKNKNNYSDLTDEEKQWYQDNYGDGQYEKYQDAINKYKNSK